MDAEKKMDRSGDLGQREQGEELQTFQPVGWATDGEDEPESTPIPRTCREISEDEREELESELSQKFINLEALQRKVGSGHLVRELRPLAWKLLLGYLPVEKDAWEQELKNNRLRYAELKAELLLNPSSCWKNQNEVPSLIKPTSENDIIGPLCRHEISNGDHPLSLGGASTWYQYFKDAEIRQQIDRDLQRTHPDIKFFSEESAIGKNNKKAMRTILLLFAKLNPAIGYVQGMNEVLAPLYYVFSTDPDEQNNSNAEADSFCCFVRLLSDSVDHFCQELDNSAVGIHATLSQLTDLLKANDEELWRHLELSKVKAQFYAFRWITLLLTQEFDFHSILRIWDSLLSNPLGVQEMLLRVCCAMLLCVKRELLDGDFMTNLKLLQRYPQTDIEHILDVAQRIISSQCSYRQCCLQPGRNITL